MSKSIRKVSDMMPRTRRLYSYLKEEWSLFKEVCNARWKDIDKPILKGRFTEKDVLGSGYFGIVLKTENKKLVVKVTSDPDEASFTELILSTPDLRFSPGLPYIFDLFQIPEWDAYVILRENMHYGVPVVHTSSPIARTVQELEEYGRILNDIDHKVASLVDANFHLHEMVSPSDTREILKEAQGLIRVEIIKTLSRLPSVSENSQYYSLIDVVRIALDRYGIALWDLHKLNLGKHKYDLSDLVPEIETPKKNTIALLDVGGNLGSPVLSQIIDEEIID